MRKYCTALFITLLAGQMMTSCKNSAADPDEARVDKRGEEIFIIDQTGKRWEVSHAVNKYDFEAEKFQFGIGPNAILPVLNSKFISPGDSNYPSPDATFLVMGVNLNNELRAYPINKMSQHEVVDEVFGDTPVAVAY